MPVIPCPRVVITAEPPGERYVDINFTDAPSLDFWVGGQLVEEESFLEYR